MIAFVATQTLELFGDIPIVGHGLIQCGISKARHIVLKLTHPLFENNQPFTGLRDQITQRLLVVSRDDLWQITEFGVWWQGDCSAVCWQDSGDNFDER